MEWLDVTSYSREDKDRTPSIWKYRVGDIVICVHRHIYYPKDMWLLSCSPFFDKFELKDKDISEAKKTSIGMVRQKLINSLNFFEEKKG